MLTAFTFSYGYFNTILKRYKQLRNSTYIRVGYKSSNYMLTVQKYTQKQHELRRFRHRGSVRG